MGPSNGHRARSAASADPAADSPAARRASRSSPPSRPRKSAPPWTCAFKSPALIWRSIRSASRGPAMLEIRRQCAEPRHFAGYFPAGRSPARAPSACRPCASDRSSGSGCSSPTPSGSMRCASTSTRASSSDTIRPLPAIDKVAGRPASAAPSCTTSIENRVNVDVRNGNACLQCSTSRRPVCAACRGARRRDCPH